MALYKDKYPTMEAVKIVKKMTENSDLMKCLNGYLIGFPKVVIYHIRGWRLMKAILFAETMMAIFSFGRKRTS